MAELYESAADLERLYGLLVVKNGHLVAEKYFNEGSVEQKARMQSATKSFTSALVGIALEQGCLSSVEQKMLDFFPEVAGPDHGSEEGADHHPADAANARRISLGGDPSGSLGGASCRVTIRAS